MRIDNRAGSKDYIDPLRRRGVEVEETTLEAGDMEILGNGPEGSTLIGVEHKKLPDLFQCIRNGRFAEQLRKMREYYEVSWILIEGRMHMSNGSLYVLNHRNRWFKQPGGLGLSEVFAYILTMTQAGGILLAQTEDQEQSVEWLRSLNNWWTAKEWAKHRAHLDHYRPEDIGGNPLEGPSFVHKVAFQAPGLGAQRAYSVSQQFETVEDMVNATEAEWSSIPGVGKKGASTLHRVWRE